MTSRSTGPQLFRDSGNAASAIASLTRHSLARSLGRESERLREPLGIGRPYLRIDDAGRPLAVERHDQLLGGDSAHIGARLAGDAGGMRARDHIVELQQRM